MIKSVASAVLLFGAALCSAAGHEMKPGAGDVLLRAGQTERAEAVYRENLRRNPENGWALVGLRAALQKRGTKGDADAVDARLLKAWSRADVAISASRFG